MKTKGAQIKSPSSPEELNGLYLSTTTKNIDLTK